MIGQKYCPQCDSEDVSPIIEGETEVWMCQECGHSASEFPERKGNTVHYGDADDEDLEEFELHEEVNEHGPKKSKVVHLKNAKKSKTKAVKAKSKSKKGAKKK